MHDDDDDLEIELLEDLEDELDGDGGGGGEPSDDADDETWAPFVLYPYEDGVRYGLILSESRMGPTMETFESAGRHPGGYGWADVATHLVATEAPELEGRFDFDPEAGMFCAYGDDVEALQELAGLLHTVFHDLEALAEAVAEAPWEWD